MRNMKSRQIYRYQSNDNCYLDLKATRLEN
jgi:hypothetical protein